MSARIQLGACRAPTWCDCDDCRFWRKHRYYARGWLRTRKRYPWEPSIHVRAWQAIKRWPRVYNPIALLRMVDASGYGDHEDGEWFRETPETRVATMVLKRWDKLVLVFLALFGKWDTYSASSIVWWLRTLYRVKATLCLLFGWRPKDWRASLEAFDFTHWGVEEYGTPDGPGGSWEALHVGYGWGNWFAYVEHESWP